MHQLKAFSDKPVLVVIFSCNHCPYVQAFESRLIAIQRDYANRGVQLVAINANDPTLYAEDDFPHMVQRAKQKGYNFPYLRDEDQSVASQYGAMVTPEAFVFDANRRLRYHGRIEDHTDPDQAKTHELRDALDALLLSAPIHVPETRAFGCTIKWAVKPPA
jgi:thiol-disulfide isomerase/thioredoxin